MNKTFFINDSNSINETSNLPKDLLGYDLFPHFLLKTYRQRIGLYLTNFKELMKNIEFLFNSEFLEEKIDSTINIAEEIFFQNNRINNLILNFIYHHTIFIQNYYPFVIICFYIITAIQFSPVLLTLIFSALNFFKHSKNRKCLVKCIGHFNWLLAAFGLMINSILVGFIFFFGSIGLLFGDEIKNLKTLSENAASNNTNLPKLSSCFEKNGISRENYYNTFLSNTSKFAFDEFDKIYESFIAIRVFDVYDIFDQAAFISDMKKYLKYIETPNKVFIDIDWKNSSKPKTEKYAGNGNAEFERLLDYQNSFSIQFYLECAQKLKVQITYNHDYCVVPLSIYNLSHDVRNRYCYGFQDFTKENLTRLSNNYNVTGCKLNLTLSNGVNYSLEDVLMIRFDQLKKHYDMYDAYKSYFYKEVIAK